MKTRYMHVQKVVVSTSIGRKTVDVQHDHQGAGPMGFDARLRAYARQNNGRPLTARQHRQLGRMAHRVSVRDN